PVKRHERSLIGRAAAANVARRPPMGGNDADTPLHVTSPVHPVPGPINDARIAARTEGGVTTTVFYEDDDDVSDYVTSCTRHSAKEK
ncbi:hypothetical protein MTO96_035170, partial [Rhipicephalus appendiculatus]